MIHNHVHSFSFNKNEFLAAFTAEEAACSIFLSIVPQRIYLVIVKQIFSFCGRCLLRERRIYNPLVFYQLWKKKEKEVGYDFGPKTNTKVNSLVMISYLRITKFVE